MVFWYIFVFIAALLVVAAEAKKNGPRAAVLDDFSVPTAEEGRAIPVVFGTVDITGSNVLWYGDLSSKKIKKKSWSGSQTIGFKYFLGFDLGLCYGPVDEVTRVTWDEKTAWQSFGTVTESTDNLAIALPNLFGGNGAGGEGGISGNFDLAFGEADQAPNAYLDTKVGFSLPAFRGVCRLIWKSGYIGNSKLVKPIAVQVVRCVKGWQSDAPWYPEKCVIYDVDTNSKHMNAAHIIYEAMTNTEWGMSVPAGNMNDDKFREIADLFYSENMGLSLAWNQPGSVEDFLKSICNHAACSIILDPSTGLYEIVAARGNYDVNDLEDYTQADIKTLDEFKLDGWGETINEVTIQYTDHLSGKLTPITQQDLGNIEAQGKRLSTSIELKGIRIAQLARDVLSRELVARSTPVHRGKFTVNQRKWHTQYGQLFAFTWPERQVEGMACRVMSVKRASPDQPGYLKVEFVEDIFALGLYKDLSEVVPGGPPDGLDPPTDDDVDSPNVISSTLGAPPASPADGDRYLVSASATGAWAGHGGEIAIWDEENGAWEFVVLPVGAPIYDETNQTPVTVDETGAVQTGIWTPSTAAMTVETTPIVDEIYVPTYGPDGYKAVRTDYLLTSVNVSFDDTVAGLGAINVQEALEALEVLAGSGGIPEAPIDGNQYARKDAGWDVVASGGGGISEAPIDGVRYSRKNAAWEAIDGTVGWIVVDLANGGSDSAGWSGYTVRQVYADIGVGIGSKVRITVRAPISGSLTIDDTYVGQGAQTGDNYDFAATPQRITWDGGSNSVTISAGAYKLSDEITLTTALDGFHNLVIAAYFITAANLRVAFTTVGSGSFIAGAYKLASDAATVNASGYTVYGRALVQRVEIFKP